MSPKTLAYIRVSTADQCIDRQVLGLKEEADALHVEHASAAAKSRPVFDAVLAELKSGDTLLVWDLDRAFRSTIDAITVAQDLRRRGIALKIAKMQIDTSTPQGEFFYTVIAAFAEMERKVISQRTKEGLASARGKGKQLGRPRLLSEAQVTQAQHRLDQGAEPKDVAASLQVSRHTLQRAIKKMGD